MARALPRRERAILRGCFSKQTVTEKENNNRFLPSHDVTVEAPELSHDPLRKERRILNSPRFNFLCLVELRLKTKIKMFYRQRNKDAFLVFILLLPQPHPPSKV